MPCPRRCLLVLLAALPLALSACGQTGGTTAPAPPAPTRTPTPAPRPVLAFRAQELPFTYERGESGSAWPVETTGGGVGLLDFDGDGDLDLYFAQGVPLPVGTAEHPPADVLLRNDGGQFVDIGKSVGLTSKGYGQGVAVADYDADGDPDVYVTRYGANTLWRNDGGTFTDATDAAKVGCDLWSLGAAFFDYDNDGDLDLFVANYFSFDPALAPFERDPETGAAAYGAPAKFPGQPDVLYRNNGDGTFTDVTDSAGVAGEGRGMGVLAADFDGDGRMDILVANDAEANALWHNRGDGTFEEVATERGLALNAAGRAEANMGIARGDADGDGLQDVLITHFYDEHDTLWLARRGPAGLFFEDRTSQAGLGVASMPFTGWGTAFADLDADGHLDLVVVNGHIRPERAQPYRYENPPLLWLNDGRGHFTDVTKSAGPYFQSLHMARGLAAGDLDGDGDGDVDLVVVHHKAPSVVLWNESPPRGGRLGVRLRVAGGNRDAVGAVVNVRTGGREWVRSVDGGGSYISSGDRRLHFGLGPVGKVDRVEVRWPSGKVEVRENIPAGSELVLEQDREGGPP